MARRLSLGAGAGAQHLVVISGIAVAADKNLIVEHRVPGTVAERRVRHDVDWAIVIHLLAGQEGRFVGGVVGTMDDSARLGAQIRP